MLLRLVAEKDDRDEAEEGKQQLLPVNNIGERRGTTARGIIDS